MAVPPFVPVSRVSAFSPDYFTARARFRSSAAARGFRLVAHPVEPKGPGGEELTIDVAILGDERPSRAVIVSSGLHGVEGFLGSAVQLALLDEAPPGWSPPAGSALVLIHAIDAYGFAWLRRFDQDNVDLNRNFLVDGQAYSGSPPLYPRLDPSLNPPRPPSRRGPFLPGALASILRHGMNELKQAIAEGQYDYPRGIFFGGHRRAEAIGIVAENLTRWVGDADPVLHVDFHTGLGRWGTYKLLIDHPAGSPRVGWLAERFGAQMVEPWEPRGLAYKIRGGLGDGCQSILAARHYDMLCAEAGTYPGLTVVAALRAENQAHHWGTPDDPATRRAKLRLKEVFAPADPRWRETTLAEGLAIVRRAMEVGFG